ncbi:MAG: hypothetical protein ACTHK1_06120 [Actinomycetales bacterium]
MTTSRTGRLVAARLLLAPPWAVANLTLGVGMVLPVGYVVTLAAYLRQRGHAHHAYVDVRGRLSPFSGLFDSDEVGIIAVVVLLVTVVLLALTAAVNHRLAARLTTGRRTPVWGIAVLLQLVPSLWVWR